MASANKGSFIVNFWLMTTGAKSCRDASFDPSRNHEIIEFADDGSIIIKDKTRFEQQLLGRYFKSKDPKLKKWRRNFTGKGYSQHFRMVDAASCEQQAPDFVCTTPSDGICWCEIKESGRACRIEVLNNDEEPNPFVPNADIALLRSMKRLEQDPKAQARLEQEKFKETACGMSASARAAERKRDLGRTAAAAAAAAAANAVHSPRLAAWQSPRALRDAQKARSASPLPAHAHSRAGLAVPAPASVSTAQLQLGSGTATTGTGSGAIPSSGSTAYPPPPHTGQPAFKHAHAHAHAAHAHAHAAHAQAHAAQAHMHSHAPSGQARAHLHSPLSPQHFASSITPCVSAGMGVASGGGGGGGVAASTSAHPLSAPVSPYPIVDSSAPPGYFSVSPTTAAAAAFASGSGGRSVGASPLAVPVPLQPVDPLSPSPLLGHVGEYRRDLTLEGRVNTGGGEGEGEGATWRDTTVEELQEYMDSTAAPGEGTDATNAGGRDGNEHGTGSVRSGGGTGGTEPGNAVGGSGGRRSRSGHDIREMGESALAIMAMAQPTALSAVSPRGALSPRNLSPHSASRRLNRSGSNGSLSGSGGHCGRRSVGSSRPSSRPPSICTSPAPVDGTARSRSDSLNGGEMPTVPVVERWPLGRKLRSPGSAGGVGIGSSSELAARRSFALSVTTKCASPVPLASHAPPTAEIGVPNRQTYDQRRRRPRPVSSDDEDEGNRWFGRAEVVPQRKQGHDDSQKRRRHAPGGGDATVDVQGRRSQTATAFAVTGGTTSPSRFEAELLASAVAGAS